MPSLMERFQGAYRGFREPAMFADPNGNRGVRGRGNVWGDYLAREVRYRLSWAFYEQNAFRDIDDWPQQFRATYGLYEGIRDLFGVAHQLGEFWPTHLQGGDLDPMAGDGKEAPSALPILMDTENQAVREALAELWKRNNHQIQKDVATRFGSVCGDVFWEISDDAGAETIRLTPIPPGRVKWVDLTTEGNIEAHELEYWRPDPRRNPATETKDTPRPPDVKYNEVVTPIPNGGGYQWKTYLNGMLFQWPGNPADQWPVKDLPFDPLVKIQHKNIGMGWGQAEAMAALSGMREVSDLASCLTDWCRLAIKAPHLMAGMKDPATDPLALARAAAKGLTLAQRRSGLAGEFAGNEFGGYGQSAAEAPTRGANNYLYVQDVNAKATSLVHPLPVDGVGAQIDRLREKNREDYPELSFERIRVSGQASAEAIREARKPAEAKVHQRRTEYDAGSARAFKMAITLGGLRGYRHYEPFNAASYDDGELDFRIGPRPAFAPDPIEQIAERQARYTSVKAATDAGLPLALAMREAGYSKEDIAAAEKAALDAQKQAMAMAQAAPKKPAFGG